MLSSPGSSGSPIQMLPPEVLARIFAACLPSDASARLDLMAAPLVLCRVCSWWRDIALSKHSLWNTVIFGSTTESTSASRSFIRQGHVDEWFDRAGHHAQLSLGQVDDRETHTSFTQESPLMLFEEYTHLITKYADRLRHLSIVLSKIPHRDYLRDRLPEDVTYPGLTSLAIDSKDLTAKILKTRPTIATPFNQAPKLREVSFTLHHQIDPLVFELPWRQLTKVSMNGRMKIGIDGWMAFFDACPNMEEGVFPRPWARKTDAEMLTSPNAGPLKTHKALKSLTIVVSGTTGSTSDYLEDADWNFFERPVAFPSLKSLELDFKVGRFASSSLIKCTSFSSFSNLNTLVFKGPVPGDVLPEAREFVMELNEEPGAFTALTHLIVPYGSSQLGGVRDLLKSRPASSTHPGLQVSVDLTGIETWERRLRWVPFVRTLPVDLAKRLKCFALERGV